MSIVISQIEGLYRWLARPILLFYALPWLMALLVMGTLAQSQVGLYAAHQTYFSAWIIWLGPLPLPGTYLTLILITLSLTTKFLLGSPWNRHKLGTTLTHMGVLLLLYGGIATALTQREAFMVINEGESTNQIADYHSRVLKIFKNDEIIAQIAFEALTPDQPIAGLPFTVTPTMTCLNCSAEPIEHSEELRHGMAEKINLIAIASEKENERNLSGMMFTVVGTDETDGLYASLEDVPMIPQFKIDENVYGLQVSRKSEPLPFTVHLVDFVKDDYPGTFEARTYHSDIVVEDGDLKWPVRIEMNQPLRYHGYTFYQSSFGITPQGRERTVLSVVQNKGWLFPYIASAVIFAGMCMHLFQRLGRKT